MESEPHSLEVFVFGGTQGESIAIRFPNDQWGVVDCYATSTNDPGSNSLLNFLEASKVVDLAFVCLTHPHFDHYSGILQLLQKYRTREFWYSSVMSADRLKELLKVQKLVDEQVRVATGLPSKADLLVELWKTIRQRAQSKELIIQSLSLGHTCVRPSDFGGVSIVAVAPSGNQAIRFEQSLTKCFSEGHLRNDAKQPSINRCSIGVLLSFNKFRIMLGGDVERDGWRDLLGQRSELAQSIVAVKVAHHGSQTGSCDGLWEAHGMGQTNGTAVLTPYKRFGLPSQKVVTHIQNQDRTVYSTGRIKRSRIVSPIEAVAMLLVSNVRNDDDNQGIVGIHFPSEGEYTVTTTGKALKLKPRNEI